MLVHISLMYMWKTLAKLTPCSTVWCFVSYEMYIKRLKCKSLHYKKTLQLSLITMNFLLIFLFTYNNFGGLFKSTQHGHWLSFVFVFWMQVCINLKSALHHIANTDMQRGQGMIHLTEWYLHWGKTGVLFNVTYIHSKTGSSVGTTILSGQEKKSWENLYLKKKLYGQVKRFHTPNMMICSAAAERQFK